MLISLNIGGVREWLRPPTQKYVEKPPLPVQVPARTNSVKAIRLQEVEVFTPVVKLEEQKEYLRYLDQFSYSKSPFKAEYIENNVEVKPTDHPDYSKFHEHLERQHILKAPDESDLKLYESIAMDTVAGPESKSRENLLASSYQRWFDSGVYPKERAYTTR